MERFVTFTVAILLVIVLFTGTARAEIALIDDVQNVAESWLRIIVQEKGHWSGSTHPQIAEIKELKRGNRILGYYVQVEPLGFMVVSIYMELAPIKVYSVMGAFDPDLETGLSGFTKDALTRVLDRLEDKLGSKRSAISEDIGDVLEINYRQAWTELSTSMGKDGGMSLDQIPLTNYKGGQVLLTTEWNQDPPYNDQCTLIMLPPCYWPRCHYNQNAYVGCVALAGAQTMRFWNWPPYGRNSPYNVFFDWPNMPETLKIDTVSPKTPLTCTPPQVKVDAVAQLCALVGDAVSSDYGCDSTGAQTYDLVDAFEDEFHYSDNADVIRRFTFPYPEPISQEDWFEYLKSELNQNRPVPYRIPGHAIVADGWKETGTEPSTLRYYHMNWGHGEAAKHDGSWKNCWYALDAIYGSDPDDEYMLINIVPENAVGSSMAGHYSRLSFPYRYFDQDTSGSNATFGSGQMLQTLEGVRITGTDTTGYYVRFMGSLSSPTKIYIGGDPSKGIRIQGTASRFGSIRLSNGGSISLSRLRPPRYPRAVVVNSQQIHLSWEQGRGMDTQQFIIERKIGVNGVFSYHTKVGATFFADMGLTSNTLYIYRVKTVEPSGVNSKYSMEFYAYTE